MAATIIASLSEEENWRIARAHGVWGYRPRNYPAVSHARGLTKGDQITFWRGQRGGKSGGLPEGFIALGRLTEDTEYPWPPSKPIPWTDGDYAVRVPFEIIEEYDPPVHVGFPVGGTNPLGIARFHLMGGLLDDSQVDWIRLQAGVASTSTPPSTQQVAPPTVLGIPYKPADEKAAVHTGDPFAHDPEVIERGLQGMPKRRMT